MEKTHNQATLYLKDIVPAAQTNIQTQFILLDKGVLKGNGETKTCLALVADETAALHFQLWASECDAFQTGDIINLSNGIFSYQRNNLVLRAGKRGKIEKIGEYTLPYVETPNMSEIAWVVDPNNPKKYVQEKNIIGEEVGKTVTAEYLRRRGCSPSSSVISAPSSSSSKLQSHLDEVFTNGAKKPSRVQKDASASSSHSNHAKSDATISGNIQQSKSRKKKGGRVISLAEAAKGSIVYRVCVRHADIG